MDDEGPQREAAFRLAIPRPPAGERRVPLDPDAVSRLGRQGWAISIERGAGDLAGFPDAAFETQGATIVASKADLRDTDVLLVTSLPDDPCLSVNEPTATDRATESDNTSWIELLRRVPTIIGLLNPLDHLDDVRAWSEGGQTAFSLDLMPRASRSLLADATASQGSLAGYRGALLAAAALDRTVPFLVLPAGSLPPARFLIVGSDPVGLQAAITAHRLGAIVEVYDPRASEREIVESIGATFIGGDIVTETGDRPSRAEAARRQQLLLAHHARHADAIILAAITPGRPAPKLVSEEAVEAMRPGSVIVDLAAPWGGNCALTRPGEVIVHHQVTILGPLNPAADLAHQASTLLAHNLEYFLTLLSATGTLPIRIEEADPVVQAACVVDHGEVHYRPARSRLGLSPRPAAATDESTESRSEETATEFAFMAAPEPAESTTDNRRSGRFRHSIARFGRRHEEAPAEPGRATGAETSAHLVDSDEAALAPEDKPEEQDQPVAQEATAAGPVPTTETRDSLVSAEIGNHDPVMADAEHAEEAQRHETLAWAAANASRADVLQPTDAERDITLSTPPAGSVSHSREQPSAEAPPAAAPISTNTAPSEVPEPIALSGPGTPTTTDATSVEPVDTRRADEALEADTVTPATDTPSAPVLDGNDQLRPTEEAYPASEQQPAESAGAVVSVAAAIEQSSPAGESSIEASQNDRSEQAGATSSPAFVPERDDATGAYEPMPTDDVIDDEIPPLSGSDAIPLAHAPLEPSGTVGVPLPPSDSPGRPPGWGEWASAAPRAPASLSPAEGSGAPTVASDELPSQDTVTPTDRPVAETRPAWAPFAPRAQHEEDIPVPPASGNRGGATPSASPAESTGTGSSAAAPEISPLGSDGGEQSENAKILRWRPWRRSPSDQDRH